MSHSMLSMIGVHSHPSSFVCTWGLAGDYSYTDTVSIAEYTTLVSSKKDETAKDCRQFSVDTCFVQTLVQNYQEQSMPIHLAQEYCKLYVGCKYVKTHSAIPFGLEMVYNPPILLSDCYTAQNSLIQNPFKSINFTQCMHGYDLRWAIAQNGKRIMPEYLWPESASTCSYCDV